MRGAGRAHRKRESVMVRSMRFVEPPSMLLVLAVALYFHVIYFFRKRWNWARKNMNAWNWIVQRPDAAVLVLAITMDVMLLLVFLGEYGL